MTSINIPTYTASDDPDKWLHIYEDAVITDEWSNGEKKMEEITNYVDSKVQQWISSQEFNNWDSLKEQFLARYKKIYSSTQTVEKLKNARQRSTETLESYTEKFERRRKRHEKDTNRNVECKKLSEKQLIKYYINGLNSRSQRHWVRNQNPKTMKDTQLAAEDYYEEQDSSSESSDANSVEVHNPNEIRIRIGNSKPKELDRVEINGVPTDRYHEHGTDAKVDRYERTDVMLLQRPSQRGRTSSAPGATHEQSEVKPERATMTSSTSPQHEPVRNYVAGDDNEYVWLQRRQSGVRLNLTSKFLNFNANFKVERYNLLPAARSSAPSLTNE